MTVSYWRRSGGSRSTIECDVAIIGAGICGVSAALHLQRRGLSVRIVERHSLAAGASSRNAGFLMRGAADNYEIARREWGPDRAKLAWRFTEENLAGLREEGIEAVPTYRARPSALLALEPVEEGELRRSVELLKADGFEASWLEGGDASWTDTIGARARSVRAATADAPAISGALLNPHDASCNSWDLLRFLASRLREPILDVQEVFSIEAEGECRVRVHASDVDVLASRILLCTNAYTPLLLPSLAPLIAPRRGQMLALRAPGARLDHSYYANRGYEYFRQASDGTIVVGGCRRAFADTEVGYEDRTTTPVQSALEDFVARTLTLPRDRLDIIARWSGVMGFTPDGLPLVGAIDGAWPARSVWLCAGCTGHGMSLFHRTARLAVEAMLDGAANPFAIDRFSTR